MLDDNIAFALMAWNASRLHPRPPAPLALMYLLPYATYHEARANWRPLFFAKYFELASASTTSKAVLRALLGDGSPGNGIMNWSAHAWPGSPAQRRAGSNYGLGPFAPQSTPPALAPFDFVAYGFASCTGWAKFLASALKAVGLPAREVGAPCWNTADFAGLAVDNPNVSVCWNGGLPGAPGGHSLNNHNWVEYWDNEAGAWHFVDVATSVVEETTWFCGAYNGGCECSSPAGKAARDHDIFATTWASPGDDPHLHGGSVFDVGRDLVLSTGEPVSPLVWSPQLRSPLGEPLRAVGLRLVNRTDFYRCNARSSGLTLLAA
mmetsp:Transcript_78762/g.228682  ORF Transcript_78762/g.228682 Transcript_78762/m.228682 type:complete len:320 (-) Transcript_78762:92-1051(-)